MKKILIILFCMVSTVLHAQQSVVSAGGDFTGAGGSISFSAGLPDFYYYEVAGVGSLQFGVQHAFFQEAPDIPEELDVESMTLASGQDLCFNALETLTTGGGGKTFIVQTGAFAELIAGKSVVMKDGTKVLQGGCLHARITTDATFCDPSGKSGTMAPLAADQDMNKMGDNPLPAEQLVDLTGKELFFKVYPNPTTGTFTLEINHFGETDLVSVEVYGLRGERVLSAKVTSDQSHLFSLFDRQPGIYIIRVVSGDQIGIERIIKR